MRTRGRSVETNVVHEGRLLRVEEQVVDLPNGHRTTLEIIEHPGAAAVVLLDGDHRAVLVRQYRHATGEWLLEVPAGKLDPGEDPRTCARREAEEETGHRCETLVPLGWIWTTPGFTNERIWLFMGTGLKRTRQRLDADESLTVEPIPFDRALRMAETGEITDAKTVCALARAAAHLRRSSR